MTEQRVPRRIISLSPSVTEIIYGIGAFDRVIAVSDYCRYPPETGHLPRVGGWANPNVERIAALQPDLVIVTEVQAPFVRERLEALGIRVLVVPGQTLDDVFIAMRAIGDATGKRDEAARLIAATRAALSAVSERTQKLARPRVLCIVDRVPGTLRDLYAATEGSFLFDLIRIAGGDPVAPPAGIGYGRISKEAVVALDPDVIIDMVQGAEGRLAEDPVAVWRAELPQLKAVRQGCVHPIKDVSVLHPSQFVGSTARLFAEIIHPEIFGRAEMSEAQRARSPVRKETTNGLWGGAHGIGGT
ncbi:helical backbone metal receptor [Pyrinomonas sp.]|uniref:ABC transporter substrate-binding protein n=1 Tax=Pyrinomonas sp. TaxID=2080306 RepID=UPI00332C5EEA